MKLQDGVMTQTSNRFFDDLARLITDAAGTAQGMRKEVETVLRSQGERLLNEMDIVQREEFEAVKRMAEKAREENDRLAERIRRLEANSGIVDGSQTSSGNQDN